ncbi:MAG: hypothetical protein JJ992_00680, partial [Planctomycetes bacterium]|nr:hypothetical protein [Planctomycetota bacterium]
PTKSLFDGSGTRQVDEESIPTQSEFDDRGHWRYSVTSWPTKPDEIAESREFWVTFEHCLSNLPSSQLEAFRLRELERLESWEICEILEVTPNNLNIRLFRARSSLRRCLEANWFNGPVK